MRWWATAVAALAFLGACSSRDSTLTIAVSLLPSELPAYRSVLADFRQCRGARAGWLGSDAALPSKGAIPGGKRGA